MGSLAWAAGCVGLQDAISGESDAPARLSAAQSPPAAGARDLDARPPGAGRRLGRPAGESSERMATAVGHSVMRTGSGGRPPDRAARAPDHLDRCGSSSHSAVLHVQNHALLKIVNAPLAPETQNRCAPSATGRWGRRFALQQSNPRAGPAGARAGRRASGPQARVLRRTRRAPRPA